MNVLDIPYKNKDDLYSAYLSGDSRVLGLFDYDQTDDNSYMNRWRELKERDFPREALSEHLKTYHQKFPASELTYKNIEKLIDAQSTVVVTGQQAGLLTGPLYTIHKCMSAILFAQEKEKQLGAPVIPIFWVAGEDHDFDEVNHIHVPEPNGFKKKKLSLSEGKRSVSYIQLQKDLMLQWVDEVIRDFGEKEHTVELKQMMNTAVEKTDTITEFFSYVILVLFNEFGVVMLDANHPQIREIEAPFFQEMVEQNKAIDDAFQNGLDELQALGFPSPIESEESNSHLFIDEGDTRVLLIREEGKFRGKNNECLYTAEQLKEIVENSPERLSNNVVTRPLMQEKLLPTLAFIAGPGEIAYWSMLKSVFHASSAQMPPVVPRLSIVLVDKTTHKMMRETSLDVETILRDGVSEKKEKWIKNQTEYDFDKVFEESLRSFKLQHDQLKEVAIDLEKGLQPLVEKNWEIIEDQIQFLKQRMERSIYKKHEVELRKYDHIQNHLLPGQQPQERVLNVFYFINQCGFRVIDDLMSEHYEWNGNPKVVYL